MRRQHRQPGLRKPAGTSCQRRHWRAIVEAFAGYADWVYLGEDRVLFGSDWPNAVGVSELPDTVALVRKYFSTKPRDVAAEVFLEKFWWQPTNGSGAVPPNGRQRIEYRRKHGVLRSSDLLLCGSPSMGPLSAFIIGE